MHYDYAGESILKIKLKSDTIDFFISKGINYSCRKIVQMVVRLITLCSCKKIQEIAAITGILGIIIKKVCEGQQGNVPFAQGNI